MESFFTKAVGKAMLRWPFWPILTIFTTINSSGERKCFSPFRKPL